MCIIADPPTLVPMFKSSDPEHPVFAPVINWVMNGPGKFLLGGSTYQKELLAVRSILALLAELERRGKVVRKNTKEVDAEERVVKALVPSKDFDDPHLVALARLTGCKLICLRDPRAHRYLRSTKLYKSPKDRPRLYTRAKNSGLLCTANIPNCYR